MLQIEVAEIQMWEKKLSVNERENWGVCDEICMSMAVIVVIPFKEV
jgi:hypothetical protein